MKKLQLSFLLSFFAVCLIAINGCKKETSSSSGKELASEELSKSNAVSRSSTGNIIVAGGGTTLEFGSKTTYQFNAVQTTEKTTGHIILKFRAAGGSLFIKVDCLRLFGDNKATLSGVITQLRLSPHSNPDEFPVPPFIYLGGRVSMTVQDNGEGVSSPADLVSDIGELISGTPASCSDEWPVYLPLDGNVQITK